MEPYLRYDVSPYRAVCPFCNADEEFDIQNKSFEVVDKMGKAFMDTHRDGKCVKIRAIDPNTFPFNIVHGPTTLTFHNDGRIEWNGRLIEQDKDLVDALRALVGLKSEV